MALRADAHASTRPTIIWEPHPLSCIPENLDACMAAAKLVDVFSPNHIELASLFGVSPLDKFDHQAIDKLATKCTDNGVALKEMAK